VIRIAITPSLNASSRSFFIATSYNGAGLGRGRAWAGTV
jgi:hypothetical protein